MNRLWRELNRNSRPVFVRCCALILCFCLLTATMMSDIELLVSVAANKTTDIRVGLAALYANKSEIVIQTHKLYMGYCIDNNYRVDETFESSDGFHFTPAEKCYYSLNKTFAGYESAEQVAKRIRKLGVDAWPVAIYRNYWRVYAGGVPEEQIQGILPRIDGQYGYQYSGVLKNNGNRVLVTADKYAFLIDAERKSAYPQWKAVKKNSEKVAVVSLGDRSYRGRIEIGCYGKHSVTAVNVINIEAYLYGVVPCEMVPSWEPEALKVQAVCARSYALTKVGYNADSDAKHGYVIVDTTQSQVYKGYGAEDIRTTAAVNETKGKTVKKDGKTVPAYYYSTSGGCTEDVVDVWGSNASYLKSVPDLYETEPEKAPWTVTYTYAQIAERLNQYDFGVGTVKKVLPQIITPSGRVYSLKFRGSEGNSLLERGTIRQVLSLPSNKFKIVKKGDNPDLVSVLSADGMVEKDLNDCVVLTADGESKELNGTQSQFVVMGSGNMVNYPVDAPTTKNKIAIYGMGYGHGVGMSQSGANGMAKAGFTCEEIIAYYYTGCECK